MGRVVSRGNKPWTSRRRLGLSGCDSPVVVIGDQVVTDGVLAWRLRATFLHLVIDDESEDTRQTVMRRAGNMLSAILFRRLPDGRERADARRFPQPVENRFSTFTGADLSPTAPTTSG